MKKIIFILLVVLFVFCSYAADIVYDFSRSAKGLELRNQATVKDGLLIFSKSRSYAGVLGSNNFSFKNGGTLMMVCRLKDVAKDPKKFRFLSFKSGNYIFGMTGGRYNFSLCSGGRWSIALLGGTPITTDDFVHYAAVARRIDNKEQAVYGFQLELYVNGERVLGKFVQCNELMPQNNSYAMINTMNKSDHFNGDVESFALYERALSPAEIEKAAKSSKRVKIVTPGIVDISSSLTAELNAADKAAKSDKAKFIAASLRKSAKTGVAENKVVNAVKSFMKVCRKNDVIESFNNAQSDFAALETANGILFIVKGDGGSAFPIIDIYSNISRKGVFGARSNSWNFRYDCGKERNLELNDYSKGVKISTSNLQKKDGRYTFDINWQSPVLTARSKAVFSDSGFEMSFDAEAAENVKLLECRFPQWAFASKAGKNCKDYLVTPYMSGKFIVDPINTYSNDREYPVAQNSMQFQAYTNDDKDGVYIGVEDPDATPRITSLFGRSKQYFTVWKTQCPYPAPGNRSKFSFNGNAAIRLYKGSWFEAGQIYKKFLAEKSFWWIKDLPRTSTPEWMRNNSIWILAGVFPTRNIDSMLYLRKYFDQEFGVHYVGTTARRVWPHFDLTTEVAAKRVKTLQAAGLKVSPYNDPRLYSEERLNGGPPGWDDNVKAMAIKTEKNELYIETYGKKCLIMCPVSKDWQNEYFRICSSIAKQNFNGIYHDQLPCGHAEICFDTKHGHLANDPSFWLKGYREMYKLVYDELKKQYPNLVHTGEDASDPYLQMIDGYTAWRWVEPDAIPLFQSIYCGRIQYTGRLFNHQYPGDWESNFAKTAQQTVNGEQLGWITLEDLEAATPFRKYFKTMAWVRRAMLEYFNGAERLAPLEFTVNPGKMVSVWGNTQGNGRRVASDKVKHSVWQMPDGRIMVLFINASDVEQKAVVKVPFAVKNLKIIRQNAAKAVSANVIPEVNLAPYAVEAWLISNSDNQTEADRIAAIFHKTSKFDEGVTLNIKKLEKQKVPATFAVVPKQRVLIKNASSYSNCFRRYFANGNDKDISLIAYDRAELNFSGIDFKEKCNGINIIAAFNKTEEGGIFTVMANNEKIGEGVLAMGGRYLDYQNIPVKFNRSLKGKHNIKIIFKGKSCRIKGWQNL